MPMSVNKGLTVLISSFLFHFLTIKADSERSDGEEDNEAACSNAGANTSSANASTSSSTHHASLHCLFIRLALRRARALYGPVTDVFTLIPHAAPLAVPHCDCTFDAFVLFDKIPNPFLPAAASFQGMHGSFAGLKTHLDLRLLKARRRRRLLRCATHGREDGERG
ncbi:UPF0496 protein [Hordeum vulgare]|nr:UPF0496 protein [Hordeum vulgare]